VSWPRPGAVSSTNTFFDAHATNTGELNLASTRLVLAIRTWVAGHVAPVVTMCSEESARLYTRGTISAMALRCTSVVTRQALPTWGTTRHRTDVARLVAYHLVSPDAPPIHEFATHRVLAEMAAGEASVAAI
jgi:hypothetical protein